MLRLFYCLLVFVTAASCTDDEGSSATVVPSPKPRYSLGKVGAATDKVTQAFGGVVLMGGGTDVDDAFNWFTTRCNGGDVVILRATGTDAYNDYVLSFDNINSVETLLINSRMAANSDEVIAVLQKAEGIFIAGGNQADYVEYWRNTKLEDELNDFIQNRQGVIGGTSAGNAILGAYYFGALRGTISSAAALANPYDASVTLGYADFLNAPFLQEVITDTHFNNPDRRGRLMTFMARLLTDLSLPEIKGIGVEEQTAVCIGADGIAQIFGSGSAWFLRSDNLPEQCVPDKPLHWLADGQAVEVFVLNSEAVPDSYFDVSSWAPAVDVPVSYLAVDAGVLK